MRKKTIIYDFMLLFFLAALFASFFLSVSLGSVSISLSDTVRMVLSKIFDIGIAKDIWEKYSIIIFDVRMPRVILAALTGGSLAVAGVSMQGLLRNPLAESSTLGVSTFAALGAVFAMAAGIRIPFAPDLGTALISIAFAYISFLLILSLSYKIDKSLSTNTLILIGIIMSMFAGSIISFLVTFSKEKLRSIIFWSMGSFSGRGWEHVLMILPLFLISSLILLRYAREMDAFALGEENAGYIGVDTKKVKVIILAMVSVLVGACVSVSGSIAFVGLVIPHITRMLVGPNHKRLLPFSIIAGMIFMMLTDLLSRMILSPIELPVGVVTSMIGSVIFIYVFYKTRNKSRQI
jgi:iron complex transport system permease protein